MRYGIVKDHRFILIDEDLQRLENTLPFMPDWSADQIACYENKEVEQGHDGNGYEKGHAPRKPLEEARGEKRAELKTAFEAASKEAHCFSSLGFEIDADEVASRNVSGLIATMEATGKETVRFRAFDNTFHETSLDQLKIMQLEIVSYAQAMYETKWIWEERIDAAGTIEELNALEMDFSGKGNNGTAAGV